LDRYTYIDSNWRFLQLGQTPPHKRRAAFGAIRRKVMARAYVFWIAVATTTWTPASALTCRPSAGGVSFVADAVREAPVAAVRVAGSEKCDVVYHLSNGATASAAVTASMSACGPRAKERRSANATGESRSNASRRIDVQLRGRDRAARDGMRIARIRLNRAILPTSHKI
jgi:hypothetical protein